MAAIARPDRRAEFVFDERIALFPAILTIGSQLEQRGFIQSKVAPDHRALLHQSLDWFHGPIPVAVRRIEDLPAQIRIRHVVRAARDVRSKQLLQVEDDLRRGRPLWRPNVVRSMVKSRSSASVRVTAAIVYAVDAIRLSVDHTVEMALGHMRDADGPSGVAAVDS